MRNLFLVLVLCFVCYLISCTKSDASASLYEPSLADTTATATLSQLKEGKSIYTGTCNACHQLYSPDAYTPAQWKTIISKMATRTNLTAAQVTLVTKYVTRGK
jgi:cytochrome c5